MEKDGYTFACRNCDECVATRRSDWVSRALAEASCHKNVLVVTLTYDDQTPESRDGAAMFRYSDVAGFLKRVRRALEYRDETGRLLEAPQVRFICAGEQGSRNGRCHWHIILYSDADLTKIGEFKAPWGVVTDPVDIISAGKTPFRRSWTMWPHGLVCVQIPDPPGIAYVLKYVTKDQFDANKAKGHKRASKSEPFATGMFRMSKAPPIGWTFVMRKLNEMQAKGYCLPKLAFKIPGSRSYWWPRGHMRKIILERLAEINTKYLAEHGRPLPQWATLLSNLKDNDSDMEALGYGPQETEDDDDFQDFGEYIQRRARWLDQEARIRATVRNCGSTLPCGPCLNSLSDPDLQKLGLYWTFEEDHQTYKIAFADGSSPRSLQNDAALGRVNPLCKCREACITKKAFPRSA